MADSDDDGHSFTIRDLSNVPEPRYLDGSFGRLQSTKQQPRVAQIRNINKNLHNSITTKPRHTPDRVGRRDRSLSHTPSTATSSLSSDSPFKRTWSMGSGAIHKGSTEFLFTPPKRKWSIAEDDLNVKHNDPNPTHTDDGRSSGTGSEQHQGYVRTNQKSRSATRALSFPTVQSIPTTSNNRRASDIGSSEAASKPPPTPSVLLRSSAGQRAMRKLSQNETNEFSTIRVPGEIDNKRRSRRSTNNSADDRIATLLPNASPSISPKNSRMFSPVSFHGDDPDSITHNNQFSTSQDIDYGYGETDHGNVATGYGGTETIDYGYGDVSADNHVDYGYGDVTSNNDQNYQYGDTTNKDDNTNLDVHASLRRKPRRITAGMYDTPQYGNDEPIDYGYGDAQDQNHDDTRETTDSGYGTTPDYGYDAPTDYGYDATPDHGNTTETNDGEVDYGYDNLEETIETPDYDYGEVGDSLDYGYGEPGASPDHDYGETDEDTLEVGIGGTDHDIPDYGYGETDGGTTPNHGRSKSPDYGYGETTTTIEHDVDYGYEDVTVREVVMVVEGGDTEVKLHPIEVTLDEEDSEEDDDDEEDSDEDVSESTLPNRDQSWKRIPTLREISNLVVTRAPCFWGYYLMGDKGAPSSRMRQPTDRDTVARLHVLLAFFAIFPLGIFFFFAIVMYSPTLVNRNLPVPFNTQDRSDSAQLVSFHMFSITYLYMSGVAALLLILSSVLTIRVISNVDLAAAIRYMWYLLWILPFMFFFVFGQFDISGVTEIWVAHKWLTPQLAWFREKFCVPASTANTLCAVPIEHPTQWCSLYYNSTECVSIRDNAQKQTTIFTLVLLYTSGSCGLAVICVLFLVINTLEGMISKPLVQQARQSNVLAWLSLPVVLGIFAGLICSLSPTAVVNRSTQFIGPLFLTVAGLFFVAAIIGWHISARSIANTLEKHSQMFFISCFILLMAITAVMLMALFSLSLVYSLSFAEVSMTDYERGLFACSIDNGASCTGCSLPYDSPDCCPQWTMADCQKCIKTEAKTTLVLATILFLLSINAFQFGLVLRKHIQMYQIEYV